MTIKEIFEAFDNIGSLTFATIDGKYPSTRIAHFFAYDEEGLYFRTMSTKPFYYQLMHAKTLSVCGLFSGSEVEHDEEEDMTSLEEGSYSIRVTGDIRTVSPDALRNKAKKNEMFKLGVEDMEKYRAMRTFVLYKGIGEIFDFDFEKEHREDKLLRKSFNINGAEEQFRGLKINQERCTKCGACLKTCSFDAIEKRVKDYIIMNHKCDACGDCTIACKHGAIDVFVK